MYTINRKRHGTSNATFTSDNGSIFKKSHFIRILSNYLNVSQQLFWIISPENEELGTGFLIPVDLKIGVTNQKITYAKYSKKILTMMPSAYLHAITSSHIRLRQCLMRLKKMFKIWHDCKFERRKSLFRMYKTN
jgi:hypothetical protein